MYTKVIIEDLQSKEKENNSYQSNLHKELFAKECKLKARVERDSAVWSKSKQEKETVKQFRKQHRHAELKTLLTWS